MKTDHTGLLVQCPQCGAVKDMPCVAGPAMDLRYVGVHQLRVSEYIEQQRLKSFIWALDRVSR